MAALARILAWLALVLAPAAVAQGELNAPFRNPDFEQWVGRFESPGREVYDRREDIVRALALRPGMAVADVGAGTGLFTLAIAERVGPAGRVYAVEIARTFLDGIVRRAKGRGIANVVPVLATQEDPGLAPASVDLVFVCDAYHHFERPAETLAALHRALRPGGALVLVDYERIPGVSPEWILRHVRAGKDEFRREIEAAGFRFVEEVPMMRENYFLRFARR